MNYTTKQAAEKLDLHPGTVQRLCKEHDIGTLLNATTRILSAADVVKLKRIAKKPGNPNFGK